VTVSKRARVLPWFALPLALLCLAALIAAGASRAAPSGPSDRSIPGQLLVKPRAASTSAAFGRALDRAGAEQLGVIPNLDVRIVHVDASGRKAALRSLRGAAAVAFAEPNGVSPPAEVIPNDALWVNQWSQPKTRTDRAWTATTGSPAVKVAILDSGVDPAQPDLQGKLLPGRDFFNGDSDPSDDYGHGTQAAGVAASRSGNGIGAAGYCGGCSIIPVKITGSDGYATWSAMASGITWATDQGARVINLSFAGTSGSSTVAAAVAYAHDHGAVVTASAGNYGSSSPTYPAAYPGALAVASTNGSDALESYSNYGTWVQLAAPGCNYGTNRSTAGSLFGNFCGTSSAAPAVAGIAALAFSYAPSATNTQVEQALATGAAPVDGFVRYGRVDAWGALSALGAGSSAQTAPLNQAAPIVVASNTGPLTTAPQPGQLLWASGGGWSGAPTMSLAFQWSRCDSAGGGCVPISGATWRTYTPTSSDSGHTLRTTVSAANSLGSASAVSQPSPVVGGSSSEPPPPPPSPAPPPTTTTTTTFSGSISAKQPSKSFSLAVGSGDATAALIFGKAPSLTLTLVGPDGTTVDAVTGTSGTQLTRSLAAGTYRYVIGGSVKKGSASFTLNVSYATPLG
jgi:Subtilase family/Fervidolysin N-terminal prodomain